MRRKAFVTRGWLAKLGEIAVSLGVRNGFTARAASEEINRSPRLDGKVRRREGESQRGAGWNERLEGCTNQFGRRRRCKALESPD